MANAKGTARIRHADSGIVYTILASDLEFETVGFEDRGMGPEFAYEAELDHPELGALLWQIWEYPSGVENDRETNVDPHNLVHDFEIDFSDSADQHQQLIEEMTDWFHENFEDPAHETPYNTREGGYQYINGGPYHANDELQNQFPNVPLELIEAAVAEIESDGLYDWAPKRGMDDFEELEIEEHTSPTAKRIQPSEINAEEVADLENLIETLPVAHRHPTFEINDVGVLDLTIPSDAVEPSDDDPLRMELIATVTSFLDALSGTNAHTEILGAAEKYAEALDAHQYSVSRLYSRGVRLENAAWGTEEQIKRDELPPLPKNAAGDIESVLTLHATYIMADPRGRELVDAAAVFRRPSADVAAIQESTAQLTQAIEAVPHLIADEVRAEVAMSVIDVGSGPHPERTLQIAGTTLGQVGITLLKWVGGVTAAALLSGVVSTAGIGSDTIATAGVGLDAAVAFLVTNAASFQVLAGALGTDLGWTTPFAQIFQRIAKIELRGSRKG